MDIGEIARRAGVSRSTVSYALSGKRRISAGTQARVNAVIDEVGYRPSAAARALAGGRTNTLALLLPKPDQQFRLESTQMPFVAAVVDAAEQRGYDVLLSPVAAGLRRDRLLRLVTERRVDGLVVMETSTPDPTAELLSGLGATFATIGRTGRDDHDWVDIEEEEAVRVCTHHLADLGHRRVAFVNAAAVLSEGGYGPALQARSGFLHALGETGMSGSVHDCDNTAAAGAQLTRTLLDTRDPPTGFVVVNSGALPGVYAAVAAAGLTIPTEVSVTGTVVQDAVVTASLTPLMTCVEVPVETMATAAVTALLDRLDDPDAPAVQLLLRPHLLLRGSTARRRGTDRTGTP